MTARGAKYDTFGSLDCTHCTEADFELDMAGYGLMACPLQTITRCMHFFVIVWVGFDMNCVDHQIQFSTVELLQ